MSLFVCKFFVPSQLYMLSVLTSFNAGATTSFLFKARNLFCVISALHVAGLVRLLNIGAAHFLLVAELVSAKFRLHTPPF